MAEPEQSANREDIEQQNCKDNIVEQIAVLPAQREKDRPDALYAESEYRSMGGPD